MNLRLKASNARAKLFLNLQRSKVCQILNRQCYGKAEQVSVSWALKSVCVYREYRLVWKEQQKRAETTLWLQFFCDQGNGMSERVIESLMDLVDQAFSQKAQKAFLSSNKLKPLTF